MNRILKNILIFILPLLLKYAFLFMFKDSESFDAEDFHEDILFCLFIFFVAYFVAGTNKFLTKATYLVYILYFVLEATSYMAVSTNFTSSYMYLLLESSPGEFGEFYRSYFSIVILLLVLMLGFSWYLLSKVKFNKTNPRKVALGLILSVGIIVLLKFTGLIEGNAYHNIVRGVYGYYELQNNLDIGQQANSQDIEILQDNEVLVLVLGESTARGHMSLYGYKKETNPNLGSIKDSLFIYNDVISTDVLTLRAVPKMLTSMCNEKQEESYYNIIDIFKKAGFYTYWLSNQRPISYHDNAISAIAAQANYFKFYNHKIDKNAKVLDEVMLPRYNEILAEPGKKLIVIRLLGTHFNYKNRYPESFNEFSPEDDTKQKIAQAHYDNAVLYNDYIVHSILNALKAKRGKNALVYLSDHGENVYEEGDFFGRVESNVTKNMFEIPFLAWTSDDFELPDDFDYSPNRKFMTDHLYESLLHLFGVQHARTDFSNSIFSKNYVERNRKVINDIDYDSYFLNLDE